MLSETAGQLVVMLPKQNQPLMGSKRICWLFQAVFKATSARLSKVYTSVPDCVCLCRQKLTPKKDSATPCGNAANPSDFMAHVFLPGTRCQYGNRFDLNLRPSEKSRVSWSKTQGCLGFVAWHDPVSPTFRELRGNILDTIYSVNVLGFLG